MSMLQVIKMLEGLQPLPPKQDMHVRLLRPNEPIPRNLPHGLPADYVIRQPEWVWIAEENGEPLAMLIAGPVQNIVYLMRICATSKEPARGAAALMLLYRTALADMRQRGYNAYMVHLQPETPFGERMLRAIRRMAGSKLVEQPSVTFVGAPTDTGSW